MEVMKGPRLFNCIFNVQMSDISKSIINIAKLTTTNFVAITTGAEDVGVAVGG